MRDPKVRSICAASFPERVLHHAIMNICEPRLEAYAIHDTYACRKGNRKALHRAREFARNHAWYLKLDIRRYFDTIDHEIALGLLARIFREQRVLSLFAAILHSYQASPGKGVPIGNLISQHLANFYLGPLDHWIKETRKIKGYVRYMDDFLLFARDKARLTLELAEITRFLDTRLALQLKANIQLNRTVLGVPFLGFRVFPAHIRLLPRTRLRFSRKLQEYEKNYLEGTWTEPDLVRHVQPLVAFTDAGDSTPFRRMVIQRFGVLS